MKTWASLPYNRTVMAHPLPSVHTAKLQKKSFCGQNSPGIRDLTQNSYTGPPAGRSRHVPRYALRNVSSAHATL